MYTIKQLARCAGITARTLHYYDEIGLLKPTEVGENGYRYYDKAALLRLQQILLYRKMDLPLQEIKEVLDSPDFEILNALELHRSELQNRMQRLTVLVETVEATIFYLKGKRQMTVDELFEGFSEEQQAEYEKEAEQIYDPEIVRESNRKWKTYSEGQKKAIFAESKGIYLDMIAAMPKGPDSEEAQSCVERWRRNMDHFWTPSLEQLAGLGDLYNEDPRFKANFDKMQPGLAEFFREAIREYVKRQ
jgi:DNA-binding transcriptional MerR regulator